MKNEAIKTTNETQDGIEIVDSLFEDSADTETTQEKEKKPAKSKKKIAKNGPYRTTTSFFVCGLIACIPVFGFAVLLYLRGKAKDLELKSYCEASLLLRPIAIVISIAAYTFLLLVIGLTQGIF